MKEQDRYLRKLKGRKVWQYARAIPKDLKDIDSRYPLFVKSTGKKSIYEAREVRDQLEVADDSFWQALRDGMSASDAREKYDAALAMQRATGGTSLTAQTAGEILADPEQQKLASKAFFDARERVLGKPPANLPPQPSQDAPESEWHDWLQEVKRKTKKTTQRQSEAISAVIEGSLGLVEAPAMNVREAFAYWRDKIVWLKLENKSGQALRVWDNTNNRAIKLYEELIGPKVVFMETSKQQGLDLFNVVDDRVKLPQGKKNSIKPNTADRYVGILRKVWREIARRNGITSANPFDGLTWSDPKSEERRPSFSTDPLTTLLHGDLLLKLNEEARHIFLITMETGLRLGEVCNIQPPNIHLDHNIPHLHVTAMEGIDIKTAQSDRHIPLVGVALEAMRQHPDGFPRYFNNSNSCSAVINKFLKVNGFKDETRLTVHSTRHAYEDRLKDAEVDIEMRGGILGQKVERVAYGRGFTLEAKQAVMQKLALDYQPSII